jgi:hypothetical protein
MPTIPELRATLTSHNVDVTGLRLKRDFERALSEHLAKGAETKGAGARAPGAENLGVRTTSSKSRGSGRKPAPTRSARAKAGGSASTTVASPSTPRTVPHAPHTAHRIAPTTEEDARAEYSTKRVAEAEAREEGTTRGGGFLPSKEEEERDRLAAERRRAERKQFPPPRTADDIDVAWEELKQAEEVQTALRALVPRSTQALAIRANQRFLPYARGDGWTFLPFSAQFAAFRKGASTPYGAFDGLAVDGSFMDLYGVFRE